jgi:hypothetical protein
MGALDDCEARLPNTPSSGGVSITASFADSSADVAAELVLSGAPEKIDPEADAVVKSEWAVGIERER